MATTNPGDNIVPSQLNAGDTWKFTMSFAVYPATAGWSAQLQLINATNKYTFNATVNSNSTDFDFLVPLATTANIPAGIYSYRILVTGSGAFAGQQYCADPPSPVGGYGRLVVSPNFGALSTYDPRSAAEIELAALQSTISQIENNVTQTATFGGQSFTVFNLSELKIMELRLIERVKQEQVIARRNAGLPSGRRVFTVFGNR